MATEAGAPAAAPPGGGAAAAAARGGAAAAAPQARARKKLLCIGDSHTEAIWGTHWIGVIEMDKAGRLDVVNAGKGGEWAGLIAQRLGPLLEAHPDADGLIIFAGTNDVLAANSRTMLGIYHSKFGARLDGLEPTLASYEAQLAAMTSEAAARAPGCRVALVTLPPVGEDLGSAINGEVRRYNEAIARAGAAAAGVEVVDFYAACADYLEAAQRAGGRRPPPLDMGFGWWRMALVQGSAALRRYVLGATWDAVSTSNGLRLLTDQVHLNDMAGGLLVGALRPFVDGLLGQGGQ